VAGLLAALLLASGAAIAAELHPFTSDGCSLFPDGNLESPQLWCDCCLAHDLAYWRGGSEEERQRADEELRACVQARTGNKPLADLMFQGVRSGGRPVFPTWYRWGYGWRYGRGYAPLTAKEQDQVRVRLADYFKTLPASAYGSKYGESGSVPADFYGPLGQPLRLLQKKWRAIPFLD